MNEKEQETRLVKHYDGWKRQSEWERSKLVPRRWKQKPETGNKNQTDCLKKDGRIET